MGVSVLGVTVTGNKVAGVCLDRHEAEAQLTDEFTWSLQAGDTPSAYAHMVERIRDYVREHSIRHVLIKASAVGQARPTLSHLRSAELRGVVAAAARLGGAHVEFITKALLSRTFGNRKVDDYLSDDDFWNANLACGPAKIRREAAFLALAAKGIE